MAPKAAAAAAPAFPIEDLFTSLNRHIQRSELHLVVRVSDQGAWSQFTGFWCLSCFIREFVCIESRYRFLIFVLNFVDVLGVLVLAIAPGDEDAIRCKVVALILDDKIDDALLAIGVLAKKSPVDLSFFKVLLMILFLDFHLAFIVFMLLIHFAE